jgi:hypothetical protein
MLQSRDVMHPTRAPSSSSSSRAALKIPSSWTLLTFFVTNPRIVSELI